MEINSYVYNPYPIMGAPETPCWPRGFPMDRVQQKMPELKNATSETNFAVLQSLADVEPDVDAIYRLTHKTPFVFDRGKNF